MARRDASAISPTAYYTSAVWLHHGLSHPAFAHLNSHLYYYGLKGPQMAFKLLGGPTLDDFLLARHQVIDHELDAAIRDEGITQVIEIAAGLSPRGWRFAERFKDSLTYIEADLPGMAERKRKLLRHGGIDSEHHHVLDIDAFASDGASLEAIARTLDPARGLVIITEGLVNYFDTDTVAGLWTRIAALLKRFSKGIYLSDLHVQSVNQGMSVQAFMGALSTFVRGRVYLHFSGETQACEQLLASGFDWAQLLTPSDYRQILPDCNRSGTDLVRVVKARCGALPSAHAPS